MTTALLILSIVIWVASLALLFWNQLMAPILSYLALLCLSFAGPSDAPLLPINSTMLIGWLAMTLVVVCATAMQPAPVRAQTRGMGYITLGGIAGLTVGLLGFSLTANVSLLYGIMIVGVVAGIFFGFLLFSNTPRGRDVSLRSNYFFTYLFAKGFPTAITIMMMGVAIVLALYMYKSLPS